VAMGIALAGSKNVYLLVVLGWSGLSVILGPLIVLQCYNIRLAFTSTLLMMLAPFATIMVWRQWLQLSGDINEVLPGIAVALMVLLVTKATKKKPVITPTSK
jgi:sodium/proline symporter